MATSWAERYAYLTMSALAYALGYASGVTANGVPNSLHFAPFAIVVLGGPLWLLIKDYAGVERETPSRPSAAVYARPQRELVRAPELGETTMVFKEDEGGLMSMSDLTTRIADPDSKLIKYFDIKAVTVAEFIKLGYGRDFAFSAMKGLAVGDGLGTTVTRSLWDSLTTVLHSNHLIVKVPNVGTKLPYGMAFVLKHIHPFPCPEGWNGW